MDFRVWTEGSVEATDSLGDSSFPALEESRASCWDRRVASSCVHTVSCISWRESNTDVVALLRAVGMLVSVGVGDGAKGRRPWTVREMSSRRCERAADESRAACVSDRKVVAMSWADEAVEMA